MKAYGRLEVQNHMFLTSALDGGVWLASFPVKRLSGTESQSGCSQEKKISCPSLAQSRFLCRPARTRLGTSMHKYVCTDSRRIAGCKYK
jgi:hypothetical protein